MKANLSELFEGLSAKDLPKGRFILRECDEVKNIYYIVSGFVKVYTFVNTGDQRIVFIYKQGDVFPLPAFLSGNNITRFFTETMTPVRILTLSSKQLEKKVKDNLQMGELLIKYTTSIDHQLVKRVNDIISTDPPLAKTVASLKFLVNRLGRGRSLVHIDLPLGPKDIAALSGLSNAEASAQMAYLKSQGVVAKTGSLVIDRNKLKELSS